MNLKEKAVPPQNSPLRPHLSNDNSTGKLDSILKYFAAGNSLHRFQAESLADHCLPTTVSDLQKRHSIRFSRKLIEVPNRFNGQTRVMLYWLEGEALQTARKYLGLEGKGNGR